MEEDDSLVLPSINHPRTSYWLSKIYGEFLVIMSGYPIQFLEYLICMVLI